MIPYIVLTGVYMPVTLGSVTLDEVLAWEEEDTVEIPRKREVRAAAPIIQPRFFRRTPKRIIIQTRVTRAGKDVLRSLKNEACWQALCDFHCVGTCDPSDPEFVDYVWIENLTHEWRGKVDYEFPWLATLHLLCSST